MARHSVRVRFRPSTTGGPADFQPAAVVGGGPMLDRGESNALALARWFGDDVVARPELERPAEGVEVEGVRFYPASRDGIRLEQRVEPMTAADLDLHPVFGEIFAGFGRNLVEAQAVGGERELLDLVREQWRSWTGPEAKGSSSDPRLAHWFKYQDPATGDWRALWCWGYLADPTSPGLPTQLCDNPACAHLFLHRGVVEKSPPRCPHCKGGRAQVAAPSPVATPPVGAAGTSRGRLAPWLVAAALLLCAGLAWYLIPRPGGKGPTPPGPSGGGIAGPEKPGAPGGGPDAGDPREGRPAPGDLARHDPPGRGESRTPAPVGPVDAGGSVGAGPADRTSTRGIANGPPPAEPASADGTTPGGPPGRGEPKPADAARPGGPGGEATNRAATNEVKTDRSAIANRGGSPPTASAPPEQKASSRETRNSSSNSSRSRAEEGGRAAESPMPSNTAGGGSDAKQASRSESSENRSSQSQSSTASSGGEVGQNPQTKEGGTSSGKSIASESSQADSSSGETRSRSSTPGGGPTPGVAPGAGPTGGGVASPDPSPPSLRPRLVPSNLSGLAMETLPARREGDGRYVIPLRLNGKAPAGAEYRLTDAAGPKPGPPWTPPKAGRGGEAAIEVDSPPFARKPDPSEIYAFSLEMRTTDGKIQSLPVYIQLDEEGPARARPIEPAKAGPR